MGTSRLNERQTGSRRKSIGGNGIGSIYPHGDKEKIGVCTHRVDQKYNEINRIVRIILYQARPK